MTKTLLTVLVLSTILCLLPAEASVRGGLKSIAERRLNKGKGMGMSKGMGKGMGMSKDASAGRNDDSGDSIVVIVNPPISQVTPEPTPEPTLPPTQSPDGGRGGDGGTGIGDGDGEDNFAAGDETGDGGSTGNLRDDCFDEQGNFICIPGNNVESEPVPEPTVSSRAGGTGGEIQPVVSPAPVASAPADTGSCENGSVYQAISSSEKCFGPGTCSSGCCLYPYCLCGEEDDNLPNVKCVRAAE